MTSPGAAAAWNALTLSMADQDGVAVAGDELLVDGARFAALDGDGVLVRLSDVRAADLASRGVAVAQGGGWVRVDDPQLWPELASEAHDFLGEPPVGGDS